MIASAKAELQKLCPALSCAACHGPRNSTQAVTTSWIRTRWNHHESLLPAAKKASCWWRTSKRTSRRCWRPPGRQFRCLGTLPQDETQLQGCRCWELLRFPVKSQCGWFLPIFANMIWLFMYKTKVIQKRRHENQSLLVCFSSWNLLISPMPESSCSRRLPEPMCKRQWRSSSRRAPGSMDDECG